MSKYDNLVKGLKKLKNKIITKSESNEYTMKYSLEIIYNIETGQFELDKCICNNMPVDDVKSLTTFKYYEKVFGYEYYTLDKVEIEMLENDYMVENHIYLGRVFLYYSACNDLVKKMSTVYNRCFVTKYECLCKTEIGDFYELYHDYGESYTIVLVNDKCSTINRNIVKDMLKLIADKD